MVLAIAFIVMLQLYQLIGKRMLYNIPIVENYLCIHKFKQTIIYINISITILFIANMFYHLVSKLFKIQVFCIIIISLHMLMHSFTCVQKGYMVIDLVVVVVGTN